MTPLRLPGEEGGAFHRGRARLFGKIALACAPGGIAALILKAVPGAEAALETPRVVAGALIFYGIAFLLIEKMKKSAPRAARAEDLPFRDAFFIGLFQILALVPGTSRSGATILGALLLGAARPAAAEFSFFMALPVMAGMSALKIAGFGLSFSSFEWLLLLSGALAAHLTSLLVMRALLAFLRRHSFSLFGWYRIALGAAVLFFPG